MPEWVQTPHVMYWWNYQFLALGQIHTQARQNLYILAMRAVKKTHCRWADLHGDVHEFWRHVLIGTLEVAHKMSSKVLVLVSDERVRSSLLAGAARPTDAMRVCVNISRDVVVHHRTNVRDVKAARYIKHHARLHDAKEKCQISPACHSIKPIIISQFTFKIETSRISYGLIFPLSIHFGLNKNPITQKI